MGAATVEQHRWTREKIARLILLAILLLGLPLLLASAPKVLEDGDVSWHIASGRWIFEHRQIPTADPFSFTAAGHPWVAMEWLADLIFASAFSVASYAGLSFVVAVSLLATNWILYLDLRRWLGPIGIAAALIAVDVVLSPFILARPQVLVWPLLAGWTVLLLRAAESGRPPPLWSALILVIWTNIHASFPLAIPIAAAIGFDALRDSRWKTWRPWATFMVLSLIAVCLNANGIEGLLQPFRITSLKMLPLIKEWQPSTPSTAPQFYLVLLLGLAMLLYRGVRVPAGRIVVLLLMLAMAFSQVRHQSWFIIASVAILSPLLGSAGPPQEKAWPLTAAAIPALALRAVWPLTPAETPSNPWQLIHMVPQPLRSQPVFNGYSFGGPLILSGVRPYIDGRAEIYGDTFVMNYADIADGDWAKFSNAVQRYRIRWTILPHSDERLIAELDRSPDWRRIYSDSAGVIYVRRD